MRHWPSVALAVLVMSACTSQPLNVQPSTPVSPSPSAMVTAPPGVMPTPVPSPAATLSPSPGPSVLMPSAAPTASPAQLKELSEANHGDEPFPPAPSGSAYDLRNATITAGMGNVSAFGAIDGELYTEWSARDGVGDDTWLTIDLGAEKRVSRVDLLPDASPEAGTFFNVEVSKDGKAWTTVGSGKGSGSNETPSWGSASFPAQTTRYVRIVPTSWGRSWVAVWEVRLVQ